MRYSTLEITFLGSWSRASARSIDEAPARLRVLREHQNGQIVDRLEAIGDLAQVEHAPGRRGQKLLEIGAEILVELDRKVGAHHGQEGPEQGDALRVAKDEVREQFQRRIGFRQFLVFLGLMVFTNPQWAFWE